MVAKWHWWVDGAVQCGGSPKRDADVIPPISSPPAQGFVKPTLRIAWSCYKVGSTCVLSIDEFGMVA